MNPQSPGQGGRAKLHMGCLNICWSEVAFILLEASSSLQSHRAVCTRVANRSQSDFFFLKSMGKKSTSALFFFFFFQIQPFHLCVSLYLSGPSQSPRERAGASLGAADVPPVGSICANMTHSNRQPHANLNLPYARVLSANKSSTKGTRARWYSIMRRGGSSVDTASHGSVRQRRYIQNTLSGLRDQISADCIKLRGQHVSRRGNCPRSSNNPEQLFFFF